MKLKQISVFLENRPGHVNHICRVLAKNNIDIATLTLADTAEFGLLRLIIREWEKAVAVLESEGCAVNVTDVMAIEVPDTPGGLANVLAIAEQGGLSVEYMYAFSLGNSDTAQLVFRFGDMEKAATCFGEAGINVLAAVEFYR
ncbi:MAG: amino acid-binding protein [Deltaproteobacteria bacterium]|nr:amino acid-binding protein [Deltaproteobacteria bacterium]MBN2671805.1 amino acid-binding protein [Deltaproteobacteria bacterium]